MRWIALGLDSMLVVALVGCGEEGGGADTGAGTEATNASGAEGSADDEGGDGSTAGDATGSGDAGSTEAVDDASATSGDDGSTTAGDTTGGTQEIEPCHRPGDCELGESCTSENGTECACVAPCQGMPTDPPPPPIWSCVEPSSDGCPMNVPVEGEPCEGSLHCTYALPASCGGTRADCVDGMWMVDERPVPP